MKYFCTYFDQNYLNKGLVLFESLKEQVECFRLFVLCLDDVTFKYVFNLADDNIICIKLEELEKHFKILKEIKGQRSLVEYYFTCTPAICCYLFEKYDIDLITYLDSDLFFYSNPEILFEEIKDFSIAIIPHNFSFGGLRYNKYGKYNVGWVSFRNDEFGRNCAIKWKDDCINWCYDRLEDGKFADQKYLDNWEKSYEKVCIIKNKGANLAPWNIGSYKLSIKNGKIFVDEFELVFYHFASFRELFENIYSTSIAKYFKKLTPLVVEFIYRPYISKLIHAIDTPSNIRSRVIYKKFNIKYLSSLILTFIYKDLFYHKCNTKEIIFEKNIVLYGGFPPPTTGPAIVNKYLLDILSRKFNTHKINTFIIENKFCDLFSTKYRYITSAVIFFLTKYIIKQTLSVDKQNIIFFCLSSNFGGLLKDLLFIRSIKRNPSTEIIGYVHNGNYSLKNENKIFSYINKFITKELMYIIFLDEILIKGKRIQLLQSKIRIIENTIDTDTLCTEAEIENKKTKDFSIFRVLFLANFINEKGYWDAVKAINIVRGYGIMNIELCMVGNWPSAKSKNEFIDYLQNNNLIRFVKIFENITIRSKIKEILLNSSVMVLPTYYKYEAQPLSIIEGMNAGLPIISTRHGSITGMVEDGVNGFLVDSRNPQQIAEKIMLLMDEATLTKFSINSRKIFKERFTREEFSRKIIDLVS